MSAMSENDTSGTEQSLESRAKHTELSQVDGMPLTITRAAMGLQSGEWLATDLLRWVFRRAEALDDRLGCYVSRTDDDAWRAAERADRDFRLGINRGPLQGIPLGVKDIINMSGVPTTAQSRVTRSRLKTPQDAEVVRRLRAAGAVFTGKLATSEFAFGIPDGGTGFPIPRNPYDLDRWAGGSSSGTGNGVASGIVLGGLGTDTGGSIRAPASWCGVSGLKPTFGLVPKAGCVPLAWTFDTVGPMARSARDCAAILATTAGKYENDPSSAAVKPVDYLGLLINDISSLRIGVDWSLLHHPLCDREVAECFAEAILAFEASGMPIVSVALPLYDEMATVTTVGIGAEALAYHRNDLTRRWLDYGASTRLRLASGSMASSADVIQAQRVRREGIKAAVKMFESVDVVLTPTTITVAPLLIDVTWEAVGETIKTQYWNACGFPCVSIPMGLTKAGLPLGLQIAGRPFDEVTVLRIADKFQMVTSHHLNEAPLIRRLLPLG